MPLGPRIEETKDLSEVNGGEAGAAPDSADGGSGAQMPPVVRSVLELTHSLLTAQSLRMRVSPGYQGGLFYHGRPYCIACGYRDGTRGLNMDDKGNHMRLKDPAVVGTLGVPIAAMLACQLHDEGRLRLDQPLMEVLPELVDGADGARIDELRALTPLAILSFQHTFDEGAILRLAGAPASPRAFAWRHWRPAAAYHAAVTEKVDAFFGHGIPGRTVPPPASNKAKTISAVSSITSDHLAGSRQPNQPVLAPNDLARRYRDNFLRFVSSAPRSARVVAAGRPTRGRAVVPHFTMALLAAAMERAALPLTAPSGSRGNTGGSSTSDSSSSSGSPKNPSNFEDHMHARFFRPLQAFSAGYGAPQPWRDPNSMFYTPTGQAAGHAAFSAPMPLGAATNVGSPLFNASLNLYAPVEEFGALLMTATDMIHRNYTDTKDGLLSSGMLVPAASKGAHGDVRMGLWYEERLQTYFGVQRVLSGLDYVPFAANMRYDAANDLGTFSICNTGTRRGRWLANTAARSTAAMFVKNVIKKGIKVEAQDDDATVKEMKDKAEQLQSKGLFKDRMEVHRRF